MPKLRIRTRKIVAKKVVVEERQPTSTPPQVTSTASPTPSHPDQRQDETLAQYSVRIGAQRLREQKEAARIAAAATVSSTAAASESSASSDYVTPVSSQDPGADQSPSETQRGPPQPLTYFQQLFDAKTPYFDGPHIPKGLRERDPWKPREISKNHPGLSHNSCRSKGLSRRKPSRRPKASLEVCERSPCCTHAYCRYHTLHEREIAEEPHYSGDGLPHIYTCQL